MQASICILKLAKILMTGINDGQVKTKYDIGGPNSHTTSTRTGALCEML